MNQNPCKVITVINQKGGVGKTTTSVTLAAGLSYSGNRVLLMDLDPQASATVSLGYYAPDELNRTLYDVMEDIINEDPDNPEETDITSAILTHAETIKGAEVSFDILPSNIKLAGMEVELVTCVTFDSRKVIMEIVDRIRENYDYIIIDCSPSLGFVTMNALAATDTAIIPINPNLLSVSGLTALLTTIKKMKRYNRKLKIGGMVLTMVTMRKNNVTTSMVEVIRNQYEESTHVYNTEIPYTMKVPEAVNTGTSIFAHAPKEKIGEAYQKLIEEILETI